MKTPFKPGKNKRGTRWSHRLCFLMLWAGILMMGTAAVANAGEEGPLVDLDRFRNDTPSERYVSPLADSFFHGYSTLTYADFGREFGDEPASTRPHLVPDRSSRSGHAPFGPIESGFQFDTTLIFGAVPSSNLLITTEMHIERSALDPVITEAKLRWSPSPWTHETWRMRLVMGRYWWPFGIHNGEWFSNVNRFSLVSPAAGEAVPAHYNETGVMLEGEGVSGRFAWNGLLSLGNGPASFDLHDNEAHTPYDHNGNRTVTARFGVFPATTNLQVGLSFANGVLREGIDTQSFPETDARRFGADFIAYGMDSAYRSGKVETRSYWYWSEEHLEAAPVPSLNRNGGTLEVIYILTKKTEAINGLMANGRVGTVRETSLRDGTFRRTQYGLGLNWEVTDQILFKLEYFLHDERNTRELDNNGFVFSATANF
jgi:hypothetical protein